MYKLFVNIHTTFIVHEQKSRLDEWMNARSSYPGCPYGDKKADYTTMVAEKVENRVKLKLSRNLSARDVKEFCCIGPGRRTVETL